MAVLGGSARSSAASSAPRILTILPQVLTVFHDYEHIVLGLIMIVFMIFLPQRHRAVARSAAAPEGP